MLVKHLNGLRNNLSMNFPRNVFCSTHKNLHFNFCWSNGETAVLIIVFYIPLILPG